MIIITNNASVYETYHETIKIEYLETAKFLDVLTHCRDRVHKGAKLLTHPSSMRRITKQSKLNI